MSTVKEIAKLSGFSMTTVSRVLNNDSSLSVSEETRTKILNCAEKLQYKPSKMKNEKKEKDDYKKYKIGLATFCSEQSEVEDTYYLSIRLGIEKEFDKLDIPITRMIRWTNNDSYENFSGLDGLIVIGKIEFDPTNIFFKNLQHVVFVDYSPDETKFDSVIIDFEKVTDIALDYLIKNQYKSIGMISSKDFIYRFDSNPGVYSIDKRQFAFEKFMKDRKIYNPDYVFIGEKFSMVTGYNLMEQAIASGKLPEAFLIGSDPMAIGAYRAIEESGLKVPNDIAIVSIDDIETASFMSPPLTTVKIYTETMGKTAVKLLIDSIQGREAPLKVTVSGKLIERSSCKNNNNSIETF